MRRAVRFLGVSNAQSTLSVPADGWQPTQSDPTAADMIPMVSMKSSTVRPFSACTFLNVSSTVGGLVAAAWPFCADTSRPAPASVALRSVSMRAFHSTGSRSTLAVISAGDISTASGPVLLFKSPAGANGRGTFSRYTLSASDTAPTVTFSQSSSVFGSHSTIPFLVSVLPTALKTLSATGSIVYFISSLTDTTGFMSPHSGGEGGGADSFAGG